MKGIMLLAMLDLVLAASFQSRLPATALEPSLPWWNGLRSRSTARALSNPALSVQPGADRAQGCERSVASSMQVREPEAAGLLF